MCSREPAGAPDKVTSSRALAKCLKLAEISKKVTDSSDSRDFQEQTLAKHMRELYADANSNCQLEYLLRSKDGAICFNYYSLLV
ncbi:hypothetical protein EVAR_95235_1 [Eumeta japonica]|uniref:Uncharacterized protein n=1 Tax=Eumeta variegata TaxID=151549 RepID=A0A4C1ULI6_EUMVA|nr:hypothetical protein EVAR_95235_1 [Eumeta japonica]